MSDGFKIEINKNGSNIDEAVKMIQKRSTNTALDATDILNELFFEKPSDTSITNTVLNLLNNK